MDRAPARADRRPARQQSARLAQSQPRPPEPDVTARTVGHARPSLASELQDQTGLERRAGHRFLAGIRSEFSDCAVRPAPSVHTRRVTGWHHRLLGLVAGPLPAGRRTIAAPFAATGPGGSGLPPAAVAPMASQ